MKKNLGPVPNHIYVGEKNVFCHRKLLRVDQNKCLEFGKRESRGNAVLVVVFNLVIETDNLCTRTIRYTLTFFYSSHISSTNVSSLPCTSNLSVV
jgi:hypothetical protein